MDLKPVATEKAVKLVDVENTLTFETSRNVRKPALKKEIETLFKVKVSGVRTLVKKNKKIAYVRLAKGYTAADVATKMGMI